MGLGTLKGVYKGYIGSIRGNLVRVQCQGSNPEVLDTILLEETGFAPRTDKHDIVLESNKQQRLYYTSTQKLGTIVLPCEILQLSVGSKGGVKEGGV